ERVRAAKNLNYAEIYSPIDGIVISRDVEVGQTVVSAMTVANLFTIANLDQMRVVADVDEADIGSVEEGQAVTFTVDAYPGRVFDGVVTQKRINPTTERTVVTYEVLVSTTNADHKLIPGLTANLTIYQSREDDALLVPVKATRFLPRDADGETAEPFTSTDPDHKRVWTVGADGTLTPVEITVGASDGINYQVLSGNLHKGDRVAMEYTAATNAEEPATGAARSPFAPKPPSRKK
ncbi:MAG: efflux RND transporter periplasmic adaptor subunit, partial [Muribaculaceae bacterium]|nr:efflux RND transporter periplasmic adaptor subunit [Muribaculaceae bacterium]